MFDEETVAEEQEESTPSTTETDEESTEETEEVADEEQDDSTDSDDTEEEETDDSAEEDVTDGKPKKKNAVQKSIDRLTRQRTLAEQERDYWRQQALESKRQQPQAQQPEPTTLQEPKEEDFDDYKDYVKALVKYERQVEKAESQVQAEKESKAKAQQEAAESFSTNLDKMNKAGREKYGDDFEDAMENAIFPKSKELRNLIAESPVAPEIAIFLNNNEEEALRLTRLSPLAFSREIGKLEAKFSKAPPTKKVTNAPKPIKTIKGTGGTNAKSEDNMTTEEWVKHRESELARKNKGGYF